MQVVNEQRRSGGEGEKGRGMQQSQKGLQEHSTRRMNVGVSSMSVQGLATHRRYVLNTVQVKESRYKGWGCLFAKTDPNASGSVQQKSTCSTSTSTHARMHDLTNMHIEAGLGKVVMAQAQARTVRRQVIHAGPTERGQVHGGVGHDGAVGVRGSAAARPLPRTSQGEGKTGPGRTEGACGGGLERMLASAHGVPTLC